jgi:hypothetical protein
MLVLQRRNRQQQSLQMLPSTLTLTALTTLNAPLFNSVFLPSRKFSIPSDFCGPYLAAKWTEFIPSLLLNDPSLQLAYLAISTSRIGHANKDDNLLVRGKKFYGQALLEVQRAISDPKRRHTEETLLACSTLSMFEIYEAQAAALVRESSTPTNGWLAHSIGCSRLVRARSPESFTTEKGHQTFLHARLGITISACTTRKWCFLSEPQWLTVPWKNHDKNLLHRLLDVMVFLPHLLERLDFLETNPGLDKDQRRSEAQALSAQCVTLDSFAQDWFARACVEAGDRPLWTTSLAHDPTYPFETMISFDNYHIAHAIVFYWSCCLMTQRTRHQLRVLLGEDSSDFIEAEREAGVDASHRGYHYYAVNIAQSLLFFTHPDMGVLCTNLVLFPLGVTFECFVNASQSASAGDGTSTRSNERTMDDETQEGPAAIRESLPDVLLWFMRLFTELQSRNLPAGIFLSGLMKAIGNAPVVNALKLA